MVFHFERNLYFCFTPVLFCFCSRSRLTLSSMPDVSIFQLPYVRCSSSCFCNVGSLSFFWFCYIFIFRCSCPVIKAMFWLLSRIVDDLSSSFHSLLCRLLDLFFNCHCPSKTRLFLYISFSVDSCLLSFPPFISIKTPRSQWTMATTFPS